MTFYEWIIKQTERNDQISDLAIDIANDMFFPKEALPKKQIAEYLWEKGASWQTVNIFDYAWIEYQKSERGE